jgi:hypothetical protein
MDRDSVWLTFGLGAILLVAFIIFRPTARQEAAPAHQEPDVLVLHDPPAAATAESTTSKEREVRRTPTPVRDRPSDIAPTRSSAADSAAQRTQEGDLARSDSHEREGSLEQNAPMTTVALSDAQVRRMLETKNVDWAYQMEQRLSSFLAEHARASHFQISAIDCRSTHCEIRAKAFQESALTAWTTMANDIALQPWSDFQHTGTSSHRTPDAFSVRMSLFRRGFEPE